MVFGLISSCQPKDSGQTEPESKIEKAWTATFPNLGTLSSPGIADLNQDGVLDIVEGMGRLEFQPIDTAIVASDGKTHVILWSRPAKVRIFGSAMQMDITVDGIEDIGIGGKSATLHAINGANGDLNWEFSRHIAKSLFQVRYFNFTIPNLYLVRQVMAYWLYLFPMGEMYSKIPMLKTLQG